MKDSTIIPRILILDDLFGRTHPDRRNEERASLCGKYLIEDVTGDEPIADNGQEIVKPVAQAVFFRGQTPTCSTMGQTVENDLPGTLDKIRAGWDDRPPDTPPWALVLLDLCFYTGQVTEESNSNVLGMPEGRGKDEDPQAYFGLQILQAIRDEFPDLPVVILSSKPRDQVSREFSSKGGLAFLPRDEGTPELLEEYIWWHGLMPDPRGIIVGHSKPLLLALREARRSANSKEHVLLRGEAGTGKGEFAHFIHYSSSRADKPFISVSAAAMPDNLVEDTLFGHVPGAYTGAKTARKGAFEEVDKGTIFIDEIGDASPSLQAKLLRAVQDGEIQRLGSDLTIKVDVRVISATNVDIESMAASGTGFRLDLLDRLRAGRTIVVPPLRHRKEDIALLVEKFVRIAERETPGAMTRQVETEAIEKLLAFEWQGNVRMLRNCIFKAVKDYPHVEHLFPIHIGFPAESVRQEPFGFHPATSPTNKLHSQQIKVQNIEELIEIIDSFEFGPLKREQLPGKLPKIEAAYARLLARYLRAALYANRQNITEQNPRGEIRIQPTIREITGLSISASKAADIIKQILGVDEKAIATMLSDQEDTLLRDALETALRLRPKRVKSAQNGNDVRGK